MKKKEFVVNGTYVFLINVIITLFLLTSDDINYVYYIVAIISNIIAIGFTAIIIKTNTQKAFNIIALILNIIVVAIVTYYLLKYINVI